MYLLKLLSIVSLVIERSSFFDGELHDFTPNFCNNPPLFSATRRRTDAGVTLPVLLKPWTCVAIFCHTSAVVPTIPIIEIEILYTKMF